MKPSSGRLPTMTIAASATAPAQAQSVRDVIGPSPLVAIENEPPAKLFVDPPLPEQLAKGLVFIQYRTENLRLVPVFGTGALDFSAHWSCAYHCRRGALAFRRCHWRDHHRGRPASRATQGIGRARRPHASRHGQPDGQLRSSAKELGNFGKSALGFDSMPVDRVLSPEPKRLCTLSRFRRHLDPGMDCLGARIGG